MFVICLSHLARGGYTHRTRSKKKTFTTAKKKSSSITKMASQDVFNYGRRSWKCRVRAHSATWASRYNTRPAWLRAHTEAWLSVSARERALVRMSPRGCVWVRVSPRECAWVRMSARVWVRGHVNLTFSLPLSAVTLFLVHLLTSFFPHFDVLTENFFFSFLSFIISYLSF